MMGCVSSGERGDSPGADEGVERPRRAEKSAPAEVSSPPPEPALRKKRDRPSEAQARGLDAPATKRRFTFTPRTLGPLERSTVASQEALGRLFAKCEIIDGWYDHLGAPAPYIEVVCDHVVVFGILGAPAGAGDDAPEIVGVRVLAREITPPSGFGVGVRYVPLADLNRDLECRRAVLPGAGDLFPRTSTICVSGLAPNILYLFRGVDFRRERPPADVESLRIDELLWLPQAAP